MSWLYLATLSERAKDPVFIWLELVPTARSEINVSSLSPDLCDIMVLKPINWANLITSRVSETVPIWLSFINIELDDLFKKQKYSIHSKKFISANKTIDQYLKLIKKYKIKSIEDPFAEDDWLSWNNFMKKINKDTQVVGDDLYVTNLERLIVGFLNK